MTPQAGDLTLLDDPIVIELLTSTEPARFAYRWLDGTPRVVPIWFHWDGSALVFGTPVKAPKVRALQADPAVAVSIDTTAFPYRALSVRGEVEITMLDDTSPAYASAAERYFGLEQGRAWASQLRGKPMAELRLTPAWANLIDFETRFPSALAV